MPAPTYALALDLDRDELFAASEVKTSDVVTQGGGAGGVLFEYARGHDLARVLTQPRAGAGGFLLNNQAGGYSVGGTLAAGQLARLRATYGGTTYDLVRAIIDQPTQSPIGDARSLVRVPLLGPLSRLAGKRVSTALYSSILTGTAVGHLLDAVGYAMNLQPHVTALAPAGQWGLGEPSGDALDLSGNGNDGTVTIGAGARDAAALDDAGDGCIDFDGAATLVNIADQAAIQNIFDGGGALAVLFRADSDGEADTGRLLDKAAWYLNTQNESGGNVRLNFRMGFSGTQGIWQTAVNIPIATAHLVVVVYNADATGNHPTMYLVNLATGALSTLTNGSGLTRTSAPAGTRTTDVGSALIIGNNAAGSATFDGRLDEVAVFSAAAGLTAAQATAIAARAIDAPRHIDAGQTLMDYWWLDNQDAMAALNTLKATEGPGAAIYEDGTGAVVFKDRHARLTESRSTAVQTTFRTAAGGTEPLASLPFAPDSGLLSVVNSATVSVKTRALAALGTVWSLGATVVLAPGETRVYIARQSDGDPFSGAVAPTVGGGDYVEAAGGLASVPTLDRTSGAEVAITLVAGAFGAQLTGLRLRAQSLEVASVTNVSPTIDASASQAAYGLRTYPLPIRAELPVQTAQDLVDAIVSYQMDGRATVSLTVRGQVADARLTAALAREVSDRIHVTHAQSGTDSDFFVESVAHRITAPASHDTTFVCEEAAAVTYFILDTSELDGPDLIGF